MQKSGRQTQPSGHDANLIGDFTARFRRPFSNEVFNLDFNFDFVIRIWPKTAFCSDVPRFHYRFHLFLLATEFRSLSM